MYAKACFISYMATIRIAMMNFIVSHFVLQLFFSKKISEKNGKNFKNDVINNKLILSYVNWKKKKLI